MSDQFAFFEPEKDDDIPREWYENPPWEKDPTLADLKQIMRPRELDYWNEGGQSHSERQEFLARIDARWRRWKDIARKRRYGPSGEPDPAMVDEQTRKVMEEFRAYRAAQPFGSEVKSAIRRPDEKKAGQRQESEARKVPPPSTKPNLQALQNEVDRATEVMGEAAEILRRKDRKQQTAKPTDWPKVVVGILVAFLLFFLAIAAAYQNAGVVNVWVARCMIVAGWLLFMLSIGFADYYLPLAKQIKIKLLLIIGAASLLFAVGAERLMVRLKILQQADQLQAQPTQPQPATGTATARDKVTPDEELPVAKAQEKTPLDIAPEKLLGFFERYNHAQAEALVRPYLGKWMEVSGNVVEVRRERLISNESSQRITDGIEVTFETLTIKKAKSTVAIYAMFEEQRWMDRAVVLKRNERIRVRGQIKSLLSSSFSLAHCEIIE